LTPASDYYSPDYFTARQRFLAACERHGFTHQSLPIDAPSPTAEPLTIDIGVRGPADASQAVVISSGIHGVEGFFGSAVQLSALDSLDDWRLPANAKTILIHALNPFGYAWRRRFNEENVDLNRNFLLGGETYTGAPPLSAQFRSVLTPRGLHRGVGWWTARMALLAARHGVGSFWRTLPVGQYEYPDFLHFGGHALSQTALQCEIALPPLLNDMQEVVHLDFHTGLGRWAIGDLLLGERESADCVAWWRGHFPENAVKEAVSSDRSYVVRGGFGPWLQARFANCRYRYAVAEFGTYSPRRVMQALAEELRWHHRLGTTAPEHWSRRQLADAFVPPDPRWRTTALNSGVSLVRRAFESLPQ
jgi:hypothetical protein